MPTDEERREVARKLREDASGGALIFSDFLGALAYDLGARRDAITVLMLLADLIDPDGADPGPRDLARAWGWK